jgi:acyl-CoA synthetase (AMP-forming)/AMP-acid ligase II
LPDAFIASKYLDADGSLHVVDRRVDLIVTGGANVFPAEVESALIDHPKVADVVVPADPRRHPQLCQDEAGRVRGAGRVSSTEATTARRMSCP